MRRSEWSVIRVVDAYAEDALNAFSHEGFDVITIIPREKSDEIGAPSLTIVARREYEEVQEAQGIDKAGPEATGCQVALTL